MEALHFHSVTCGVSPARIQFDSDEEYLAAPSSRTNVGVWTIHELDNKPLVLEAHRCQITSIRLGRCATPKLLCSAASDYVITWNLQKARHHFDAGLQIRGQIIGSKLGDVVYCSFSLDDSLVAVCAGNNVFILNSQFEKCRATLEGHTAPVTCAEFCPHYASTLVTASEDRTFKVWNIEDFTLIYQSSIICASPFISMAMSTRSEQVAIGTSDGQVRVYDLTDGNGFRLLHHLDVAKAVRKMAPQQTDDSKTNVSHSTISSRPTWQVADQSGSHTAAVEDSVESGAAILGLYYTYLQSDTLPWSNYQSDLLSDAPCLVVGTTSAMLQVNSQTLEVVNALSLHAPIPSMSGSFDTKLINACGSAQFVQLNNMILCVIGSLFDNVLHLLRWPISNDGAVKSLAGSLAATGINVSHNPVSGELPFEETQLSVLSNTPLVPNSALRAEILLKPDGKKNTPNKKGSAGKSKAQIEDQPLTFKSKVKSSGYTAQPRNTLFKPKTNVSKSASPAKKASGPEGYDYKIDVMRGSIQLKIKMLMKEYPVDSSAPVFLQSCTNIAERPTPVNQIRFSGNGQYLACALSNKSAEVLKFPLSGQGTSYTGHNGSVNAVSWSQDGAWLLTTSNDKSAAIWGQGQSEPIITFQNVNRSISADKEGMNKAANTKENPTFSKEISAGQFYFLDKFILLASAKSLYLYKYRLDQSRQDIKRYLTSSKYKLVTQFSLDESHQITAMSAVNSFHSYLVLIAESNKCLSVYDMNVGQCVRQIADIHTRPAHVIRQNEGSAYTAHPAAAYDLFMTSAFTDCIKLWDIRTSRCVRRFEGHLNRAHPCGVAFSPCGRYIASGAEDRAAYLFDIGSGTYSHKLTGHTDVVMDVAFHPLRPQLVTASLDGKLRVFSDR